METGSKEGESRAEVVVVVKKKLRKGALCLLLPRYFELFKPTVQPRSRLARARGLSVRCLDTAEGRSRASRRSGRTNGYLIRGLVLFALPDSPPHWNESQITVNLLL